MLFRNYVLAVALCASLALTGCSSNSVSFPDDADPRLTNQEFSVQPASYGVACLAGAAVVVTACIIQGRSREVCLAAAAIGCAVAMGANALMDRLRSSYNTREGQLDGLIADMESNRQKAAMMASTAQAVYAEDKKKFKLLKAQIKKNKADKADLENTVARYDANIKVLKDNISYHERSIASYARVQEKLSADGDITLEEKKRLRECDKQIARLKKSIKEIESAYLAYSEDSNVLHLALNGGDKAA